MAQWIPKTAWKVSNLNKRYGQQYMAQGYPVTQSPDRVLASYSAMAASPATTKEATLKKKIAAALKPSTDNPLAGAVVIDVRSAPEQQLHPLASSAVAALHPHDLLSGAARPVLPRNAAKAELFIVASDAGRAVNSTEALRRWGYESVHFVEYEIVASVLKSLKVE